MSDDDNSKTYVSLRPCGCILAAACIHPDQSGKQLAKEVAKWIAAGENVQQVDVEFVRQGRFSCAACRTKAKEDTLTLE